MKNLLSMIVLSFAIASVMAQPAVSTPRNTDNPPANTILFEEGFENDTWLSEWQQIHLSGTLSWTRGGTNLQSPPFPAAYEGEFYARFTAMMGADVTKLIPPMFDFSGITGVPVLRFQHIQWAMLGASPPPPGMLNDMLRVYYRSELFGDWNLLKEFTDFYATWTEQVLILPNHSAHYEIAFAGVLRGGLGVFIDDIRIEDGPNADLRLVATQYNQMPITQTLPSPSVENVGNVLMHNVRLDVVMNGANVASATIPSVMPGETLRFALPEIAIPLGENTITLTITSDEEDVNPSNNTITYTLIGNWANMAVDNLTNTAGNPALNFNPPFPPPPPIGNIFEITQETQLAGFEVFMVALMQQTVYEVYIFRMDGDMSIIPQEVAVVGSITAPGMHSPRSNTVFFNNPVTLEPGRYFVALAIANIGMMLSIEFENNPAKQFYTLSGGIGGNTLVTYRLQQTGPAEFTPVPNVGALAVRMIMHVDNCPEPTNLEVTNVEFMQAHFSWEGYNASYQLFVVDVAAEDTILINTASTSSSAPILRPGTYYEWFVVGLCTETVTSEKARGASFTTRGCEEAIIDVFPWTFSFEDDAWQWCWAQEHDAPISLGMRWGRAQGLADLFQNPRSGERNAFRPRSAIPVKLVLPRIDFEGVTDATLNFWFAAPLYVHLGTERQDTLRVYYRTSSAGEWQLLQEFADAYNTWTEVTIPLTMATDVFYIAFYGQTTQGWYGIALDDVTIDGQQTSAGVVAILYPQSGEGLSATEQVTATITNLGTTTISANEISVTLTLDQTEIVTDLIDVELAPGESTDHTFSETLNLMAATTTTFEVGVSVELAGGRITLQSNLVKDVVNTVVIDASVSEILAPETGEALTATEIVTITVWNHGSYTLTSLPVGLILNDVLTLSETITTSILPGDSYDFTFAGTIDLSEVDNHFLRAFTSLDGDQNTANDTAEKMVIHFPADGLIDASVVEIISPVSGVGLSGESVTIRVTNFGSETLTSLSVAYVINGGEPVVETITTAIEPAQSYTFTFAQKANLQSVTTQTFTISAYTLLIDDENTANDTMTKQVTSTVVNQIEIFEIPSPVSGTGLSTTETVSVSWRNLGTFTITSLQIAYQIDGGTPVVETISDIAIAPNQTHTHVFAQQADLSSTTTRTFRFDVFSMLDMDGAINDTSHRYVTNTITVDAEMRFILEPVSGEDLTNDETVRVSVRNLGTLPITSLPIAFSVNNAAPVQETITETIAPGDTLIHTFSVGADLSAAGTHAIRVWVALANDGNHANDTATKSVVNTVTTSIAREVTKGSEIIISPNPTADVLYIETAETIQRIEIFNARGQQVRVVRNNLTQISVSDLAVGTYIIKIVTDKGISIQRFVKK